MREHRAAIYTIVAAAVLDVIGGIGFSFFEHISIFTGIYWAVTTATTVGYGDVVAHTVPGRIIAVAVMLTVIPLFAATFSLFTSAVTSVGMRRHVQSRLDHIIHHHPDLPDFPGE